MCCWLRETHWTNWPSFVCGPQITYECTLYRVEQIVSRRKRPDIFVVIFRLHTANVDGDKRWQTKITSGEAFRNGKCWKMMIDHQRNPSKTIKTFAYKLSLNRLFGWRYTMYKWTSAWANRWSNENKFRVRCSPSLVPPWLSSPSEVWSPGEAINSTS